MPTRTLGTAGAHFPWTVVGLARVSARQTRLEGALAPDRNVSKWDSAVAFRDKCLEVRTVRSGWTASWGLGRVRGGPVVYGAALVVSGRARALSGEPRSVSRAAGSVSGASRSLGRPPTRGYISSAVTKPVMLLVPEAVPSGDWVVRL